MRATLGFAAGSRITLAALAVLAALATPAAAGWGMPEALTPRGQQVVELYDLIAILGIITFLVVFAWLVVVIWRFREHTGHGRSTHEKERHNSTLEAIWIGIPLIMVLGIGYAAYGGLVELDRGIPLSEVSMEMKITGSRYNWQADYGDGVLVQSAPDLGRLGAVGNDFLVPADTNILLNITAQEGDVIHAFNILDANRAWFSMNDANPMGSNKYALQVLNFPPGNYSVQCKEMCFNPGHAYMRGAIRAVPAAEFELWLAEQQAGLGANVVQSYDVTATGTTLSLEDNATLVTGTRVVLRVDNQASAPLELTMGGTTRSIPAASKGIAAFELATDGVHTLRASNGATVRFNAVTAQVKTVQLTEYALLPANLELEGGKTYLVKVENIGVAPHNLFIGTLGGTVLAESPTPGGGQSAGVVWKAVPGTWDLWCNIPGHESAGMRGKVTVT